MTRQYKTQRQRYPFDGMKVGQEEELSLDSKDDVIRARAAAHMVACKRGWKFETYMGEYGYTLYVVRLK